MTRKLKNIQRTSTFAWSPSQAPMIATGTMTGALDDSFSNVSELEIFELSSNASSPPLEPSAKVSTKSRFHTIGWGYLSNDKPKGIIAGGMESGELELWDASSILDGKSADDSLILRNSIHKSALKSLDFNLFQTNLLATAGDNNEVFIWDLKDPSKPYTPGARSAKMDHISDVAWNCQVQHILATSASNGYAVVWDLRHKKEVMALAPSGQMNGFSSLSSIAWHPDIATQIVTASNDDQNPIISLWDLRHAQSPEKILSGHTKGVLDVSWCQQDSDLLISSGKDCRTLCWNPNNGELNGEVANNSKWTFEVEWCPRNPDLLATASFDGSIDVYSIQGKQDPIEGNSQQSTPAVVADNPFDAAMYGAGSNNAMSSSNSCPDFELKRAPKWLQRPVSASFGFGGKLIRHSQNGVKISSVKMDPEIVQRSERLESVSEKDIEAYKEFIEDQLESEHMNDQDWKVLKTLFSNNAREELMQYLGFEKTQVAKTANDLLEKLKEKREEQKQSKELPKKEQTDNEETLKDKEEEKPTAPQQNNAGGSGKKRRGKKSKNHNNGHANANNNSATKKAPEDETTTMTTAVMEKKPEETAIVEKISEEEGNTVSNLFGGEEGTAADDSFFGQIGHQQQDGEAALQPVAEATTEATDSVLSGTANANNVFSENAEVSQTIAASTLIEAMKERRPFTLYSNQSSTGKSLIDQETDQFITKAIMLGDFESAVDVCFAAERYSDALVLAMCGSSELFARTQKAYFRQQSKDYSYLRLLEGILEEDLASIVKDAEDISQDWASILVVLCTFAKAEDFGPLCEILGDRLLKESQEHTSAAAIFYMVAGSLQKVSQVWIDQLDKESDTGKVDKSSHQYETRLQELIEKITVFRKAIDFEDPYLTTASLDAQMPSPLASLYTKYCEYAEFMASEGKLDVALKYINLTPANAVDDRIAIVRDRIYHAYNASQSSLPQQPSFPFEKKEIGTNDAFTASDFDNQQQSTYKQNRYSQQYYVSNNNQQSPYANNRKSLNLSSATQPQVHYTPSTSYNGAPQQQYSPYIPRNNTGNTTVKSTAGYTPNQYAPADDYNNNATQSHTLAQPQAQQRNSYVPPTTYQQQQAAPQQSAAIPSATVSNTTAANTSTAPPKTGTSGAWNDPPMLMSPKVTNRKVSPSNIPAKRVTTPFVSSGASSPSPYYQQAVTSAAAQQQQASGGMAAPPQSPMVKNMPPPPPMNAAPPQAMRAAAINSGSSLPPPPAPPPSAQSSMLNNNNNNNAPPPPPSSASTIGPYCSARQQFQQPPPPPKNGVAPSPMLRKQSLNATGAASVPRPPPMNGVAPSPMLKRQSLNMMNNGYGAAGQVPGSPMMRPVGPPQSRVPPPPMQGPPASRNGVAPSPLMRNQNLMNHGS